ncbi:MAG: hypothetical protein ACOCVC_00760 [Spirochaeta sp.]
MPDSVIRTTVIAALLLCPALSAYAVEDIPLPHTLEWHASNSVWMQGPSISWVQARNAAYAIGTYHVRSEGSEGWERYLPSPVRQAAMEQASGGLNLQNLYTIRQVYVQEGETVAERIELRDSSDRLRVAAVDYTSGTEGAAKDYLHVFREDGNLLLDISHSDGEIEWMERLHYHNNLLQERNRTDSDGDSLYHDTYSYRIDGVLRMIERVYPDGGVRISQYGFYDEGLRNELHTMSNARSILIRYDIHGRLELERSYVDDEAVELTRYTYADSEAVQPLTSVTEYPETDRSVRREFDDGLEKSAEFYENGSLVRTVVSRYDDQRRRVETQETVDDSVRTAEFVFSGDQMIEERVYLDGELQERRRRADMLQAETAAEIEHATEVQELYHDGELSLRVYYDGLRRIREEVIDEGQVVRIRRYNE